jgi:hypothetical protein
MGIIVVFFEAFCPIFSQARSSAILANGKYCDQDNDSGFSKKKRRELLSTISTPNFIDWHTLMNLFCKCFQKKKYRKYYETLDLIDEELH